MTRAMPEPLLLDHRPLPLKATFGLAAFFTLFFAGAFLEMSFRRVELHCERASPSAAPGCTFWSWGGFWSQPQARFQGDAEVVFREMDAVHKPGVGIKVGNRTPAELLLPRELADEAKALVEDYAAFQSATSQLRFDARFDNRAAFLSAEGPMLLLALLLAGLVGSRRVRMRVDAATDRVDLIRVSLGVWARQERHSFGSLSEVRVTHVDEGLHALELCFGGTWVRAWDGWEAPLKDQCSRLERYRELAGRAAIETSAPRSNTPVTSR